MRLSRSVEYALRAVYWLSQADSASPVPCHQLAAAGALPERFLLQILRNLVTHGILSSTRGVVGGYTLGRSPSDISLLDLFEAIEGPLVASLPDAASLPAGANDVLCGLIQRVTAATRAELAGLKVSQLLAAAPPEVDHVTISPFDRRMMEDQLGSAASEMLSVTG